MTPAFGFSVGDFISAINLVQKVRKALKETGGACAEYQQVLIELKALESVLRQLEALEPTEDNIGHVNAIRGMALACQLPLRDFLVKLEGYESKLGPFRERRTFRGMMKQSEWALMFAPEVERLRAMVTAKNISINLLLTMNISRTVSRSHACVRENHNELMLKVAEVRGENRAAIDRVEERLMQMESSSCRPAGYPDQRLNDMEHRVSEPADDSKGRLDKINDGVAKTHTAIVSLRTTGDQILRYVKSFPNELRDLLQKIMRGNWQIYQMLLQIQRNTPRSPSSMLESHIKFEDALGDCRLLPYEYFRHWEIFEPLLRTQFQGKPGEAKVREGQYFILDVNNDRAVVNKKHWTRSITQGATINMSMIMSQLPSRSQSCPRRSCKDSRVSECAKSGLLFCETCKLNFYLKPSQIGTLPSITGEDEQVTRRQAEEDVLLYGSTQQSNTIHGLDDVPSTIDSTVQLGTVQLDDATSETKEATKTGKGKTEKTDIASSSNWQDQDSPLITWLDQSSLSCVAPGSIHPFDQSEATAAKLLEQEAKEIEIFRNVHLTSSSEPTGSAKPVTHAEKPSSLELPVQIYYRNILDRYPLLPNYLIQRLAEANSVRAARLSHQRTDVSKLRTTASKSDTSTYSNPQAVRRKSNKKPQDRAPPIFSYAIPSGNRKASKKPKYQQYLPEYSYAKPHRSTKYQRQRHSRPEVPKNSYKTSFWSGGGPVSPTKSVKSHSSSMNSSLHGSSNFNLQKDYQYAYYANTKSNSGSSFYSSPGLPPPPVKPRARRQLKNKAKKLTFDCDICGRNVKVERRRQWQRHVMTDLMPYVCTASRCDRATEPFASHYDCLRHEVVAHELAIDQPTSDWSRREAESILCIFCGERTKAGRGKDSRSRHVGRHMEEIAFMVVPKTYDDWDFYSASSSARSIRSTAPKSSRDSIVKRRIAPKRFKKESKKQPLPRREANAADAYKFNIPAGYSLKNWDPAEEPILLLGSVFDANSLGKWIYDWTVFRHGAGTPLTELAGELWLLLIKLAGRLKRAEEYLPRVKSPSDQELLEDILSSGGHVWHRFEALLKLYENYMWKAVKRQNGQSRTKMGASSGCEFVDAIFGRERELRRTEALMQNIRLWNMRFDANCEQIMKQTSG